MRKIREVLRLSAAGRSQRLIAQSVGVGQSTVGDYLNRARLAGVEWPTALDDAALERALYPPRPPVPSACRGIPDWPTVHRELKRKKVTLFLLWEEYKAEHPHGFHRCFIVWSNSVSSCRSSTRNQDLPAAACRNASTSATLVHDVGMEQSLPTASKYMTRSSPQFRRRVERTNSCPLKTALESVTGNQPQYV